MLSDKLILRLSQQSIQNHKRFYRADGLNNLCVRTVPSGRVFFCFSYYDAHGQRHEKTIGNYPLVSLKEARAAAASLYTAVLEGNMGAMKEVKPLTTREIAMDWLKVKRTRVSDYTCNKIEVRLEKHILQRFGSTPFEELTPPALFASWRPLEVEGKFETLIRLCGIVREMYCFATNTGRVEGMADLGHLKDNYPRPKVTHYTTLAPDELYQMFVRLLQHVPSEDHTVWLLVRMLCFTLLRQKELVSLRWDWIDFEADTITIPADIMKSRRSFILPMSRQVRQELEKIDRISPYVFYSLQRPQQHLCAHYCSICFTEYGLNEIQTVHGLRAVGRTWMQKEDIPTMVAEACLSHVVTSATLSAYMRFDFVDERRDCMQRWCDFVDGQIDRARTITGRTCPE